SMRCGGELQFDIAAGNASAGPQKLLPPNRFGKIENRFRCAAFRLNRFPPLLERFWALRRNDGDGLTQMEHLAIGQERFVYDGDTEHLGAGDVGDSVATDDAGDGGGGARVDVQQLSGRNRAADETDVQLARHWAQIIDVRRLTRYVAERCIVRYGF